MVRIGNVSFAPLVFRANPAREGVEGEIVEIKPGETKEIDIAADNVDLVARLNAKLIVVGAKAVVEKAVKESGVAAPEKPAA